MMNNSSRIGIDESGKGDYFGPLVIGAVYVDEKSEKVLLELGVRDSKKIADKKILVLAEKIKSLCPHSVVAIGPQRYNDLYEKIKNLNKLLAWGHARALENVLEKVPACSRAISDQFGDERFIKEALLKNGKNITLEQRHRAEDDMAVAAASIIARSEFVTRLAQLSETKKVTLLKGSSNPDIVKIAREFVKTNGSAALAEVAKLHFKTTKEILASGLS